MVNPNQITCPPWRNPGPLLTETLPVLCLLQLFPAPTPAPTPKDSSLYNIFGFRLLSPILGILAHDVTIAQSSTSLSTKNPSPATSPTSPKPHLLMVVR
ncbi:hypothetical protein MRB53_020839 [Persea americana]|uniref:Uncharacterized protein n=1 Tax=Persea americana TaxID=3435 RepID=A0ACC2L2E3_PERAE|nr:hypothetical protein MRB53_020839 [Persea americana]